MGANLQASFGDDVGIGMSNNMHCTPRSLDQLRSVERHRYSAGKDPQCFKNVELSCLSAKATPFIKCQITWSPIKLFSSTRDGHSLVTHHMAPQHEKRQAE